MRTTVLIARDVITSLFFIPVHKGIVKQCRHMGFDQQQLGVDTNDA
jgi:hypothetical protein